MDSGKRQEMMGLVNAIAVMLVVDANNKIWYFGKDDYVECTAGSIQTGQNRTDNNGYTLTFSDMSHSLPYEVTKKDFEDFIKDYSKEYFTIEIVPEVLQAICVYDDNDGYSYVYKRYPLGDKPSSGICWVYIEESADIPISEIQDWNEIDTSDLIYTNTLTPSVGDMIDVYKVIEYNGNVDYDLDYYAPTLAIGFVQNQDSQVTVELEYSFDKVDWETFDGSSLSLDLSDDDNHKIYFRGVNPSGITTTEDIGSDVYNYFTIQNDGFGYAKISGNIMSLIYGDDFVGKTTMPSGATFATLFNGYAISGDKNDAIYDASHLILPTNLSENCFEFMFASSRVLKYAPALPSTALTSYCYTNMFEYCTSLVNAPELPATNLTNHCYQRMFEVCISLKNIKCLAINNKNGNCDYWLLQASSTGTFYKHPDATWSQGVSGIPAGWTIKNAF